MRLLHSRRQRGIALIALLAVLAIGASAFLIRQLNVESGAMDAIRKNRNAEVLNRAKQALIGYVAMQAAKAGERNPGRLPCPEGASYVGDASNEGTAWGGFGTDCASVGRLPWRTLGLDKLVDAEAEPLWYVVGPAWRLTNTGDLLTINSNTPGGITIDGEQVVALIIAPGKAMNVQACAGQPARNQARAAPAPAMVALDYLECFNPVPPPLQFVTGPASSYNDQVVRITVADIMPAIEAAIANRIEREIAPQLKSVYASSAWGLSSSNPLFPYPAQFNNPDPGTSSYQGASATTGGLLPVTSASCTGDPRCSTTFVAWNTAISPTVTQTGGTGTLVAGSTCTFVSATQARCTGTYVAAGAPQLTMTVRASNVAMALRQLDATNATSEYQTGPGWLSVTSSANGSFPTNDGSANIDAIGTFPSQPGNTNFRITMNIAMIADHAIIDSTNSAYGWFVRNQWHRLVYYKPAVGAATGHTAAFLPTPSCTDSGVNPTCITVANVTPAGKQRAILILAGRSVNGMPRPSSMLGDYLEFGNATEAYERRTVNASNAVAPAQRFNDRIIVIDSN